jgi:hypothetical protein
MTGKLEIIEYNGVSKTFTKWANTLCLSTSTFRSYVNQYGGPDAIKIYLEKKPQMYSEVFGPRGIKTINWFLYEYHPTIT